MNRGLGLPLGLLKLGLGLEPGEGQVPRVANVLCSFSALASQQ